MIGPLNVSNGSVSLLRSLLDGNLFDENNIPNTPYLTGHTSVALFEKWQQTITEQLVTTIPIGEGQQAPWIITTPNDAQPAVLLPGGYAGMLRIDGAAVSAGTNYPELAYTLAMFYQHGREEHLPHRQCHLFDGVMCRRKHIPRTKTHIHTPQRLLDVGCEAGSSPTKNAGCCTHPSA